MFYICTDFMRSFSADKKGILIFLSLFFIGSFYNAQRHEVGVRLGMSNLVGDIGRTGYILQKPFGGRIADHGIPFYGGIMYRMNFNPYQTLRFDLGYSHIQFDDARAKEDYRNRRKAKGTNSGAEVDAIFEYNFYPVNNEQKSMLSPYVFGGIGGILYSTRQVTLDFTDYPFMDTDGDGVIDNMPHYPNHYEFDQDGNSRVHEEFNKAASFTVPFGAGLKYKFNYNWALFGELKFRYTFSDNIDYSNLQEKDVKIEYDRENTVFVNRNKRMTADERKQIADPYIKSQQIGNPNSNDWINSITLGISYSFGRPPCYCE